MEDLCNKTSEDAELTILGAGTQVLGLSAAGDYDLAFCTKASRVLGAIAIEVSVSVSIEK
jgi:hypothetical protein